MPLVNFSEKTKDFVPLVRSFWAACENTQKSQPVPNDVSYEPTATERAGPVHRLSKTSGDLSFFLFPSPLPDIYSIRSVSGGFGYEMNVNCTKSQEPRTAARALEPRGALEKTSTDLSRASHDHERGRWPKRTRRFWAPTDIPKRRRALLHNAPIQPRAITYTLAIAKSSLWRHTHAHLHLTTAFLESTVSAFACGKNTRPYVSNASSNYVNSSVRLTRRHIERGRMQLPLLLSLRERKWESWIVHALLRCNYRRLT